MIGGIRDMYEERIDEIRRQHSKEFGDLRKLSRQLELTLCWLYMSNTLTDEQCDVIAAVRKGTLLHEAIKEHTETQETP